MNWVGHFASRWLWLLLFVLALSTAYFSYRALENGSSRRQREMGAMQSAQAGHATKASLESLVKDADAVAAGRALFMTHCAVCHLESGAGKIGPSLSDDRSIYGADALSIYRILEDGAVMRGMPAWSPTLSHASLQQLTAYTLTLHGTTGR